MNETLQLIIGLIVLVGVFILTRFAVGWKIKKAAFSVLGDLARQDAVSPETAVSLPYAKSSLFKFGLRDYRPKAIQALATQGIIGNTPEGLFFVADPEALVKARELAGGKF